MKMRLQIPDHAFVTTRFEVPVRRQPVKVCVIFEAGWEIDSGKSRRTAAGHDCEIHAFEFADLNLNQRGIEAVQVASKADILMVAVQTNQSLPSHIQFWLGVSFGLRDNRRGILALLPRPTCAMFSPDSPLQYYLKTMATLGGLEFILAQSDAEKPMTREVAPQNRRWRSASQFGRIRRLLMTPAIATPVRFLWNRLRHAKPPVEE